MKPPPERVETERLLLRRFEEDDVAAFAEMLDSSREHYAAFIPFYLDGDPAERVRRYRADFDSGEGFVYAALADGRMIGGGMLFPRIGPGALELGWQLRADAVGHGYATELAAALLDVAFCVCEVERVEAHIDPENTPSIAVAERLGLSRTGAKDDVEIYSAMRAVVSSASDVSVTSASASDSASGG